MTNDNINRKKKGDQWTLIIRSKNSFFDFRLKELWQYKDLIMLFVWRDFVTYYKQTILGPIWYLLQPLLTTITFTVIFGKFASLPTDGLPQFLFYMSGTIVWGYFSSCLTKASNTFIENVNIFGKVYFPRLTVPISVLISNLIMFIIQMAFFICFVIYFILSDSIIRPNSMILLTPFLLFILAGLGFGFGIIVSSLTTRYRDLQFLVTFGVQLWMFATPVVYPLSQVPVKYRWLIIANPVTPVIECFRYAFFGVGTVDLIHIIYSLCFMTVVIMIGILIFNKIERVFSDTV